MVEAAALVALRVRNVHGLAVQHNAVTTHRDGVDTLQTGLHAELAQGGDAAGLEKLSDYAIRLREGAFKEADAEGGRPLERGERLGERAARDAGADDDHVVVVGGHAAAAVRRCVVAAGGGVPSSF